MRREGYERSGMRVSYSEGLASHAGPESCGYVGNGVSEALTGELAGWVSSFEKGESSPGADVLLVSGRPHLDHRSRKVIEDPAESKTPCMQRSLSLATREILPLSMEYRSMDRSENPKGVRP